jgi:hypothetical protein
MGYSYRTGLVSDTDQLFNLLIEIDYNKGHNWVDLKTPSCVFNNYICPTGGIVCDGYCEQWDQVLCEDCGIITEHETTLGENRGRVACLGVSEAMLRRAGWEFPSLDEEYDPFEG